MKVPFVYTEVSINNKDPRKSEIGRKPFVPQINMQSFADTQNGHMASGKNIVSKNTITHKMLKGAAIGGDTQRQLAQKASDPPTKKGLKMSEYTGRIPGQVRPGKNNAKDIGERGLE